jgi:methionyl-tRNA formyltransferase
MNIIFFGSSEFSVLSLQSLIGSKHKLLLVVTHPDRRKGRHLLFSPSPVKVFSKSLGIEVYEAEVLDEESVKFLKEKNADLFVVIDFGKILSKEILEIPKKFCINVHPSLLPKYRGPAPINWAIINGEERTGVTVIKMNERLDSGDIILQEELNIEADDTAITLKDKLSKLAARILLKVLDSIEINEFSTFPQNESLASFARKLKKQDGLINWRDPAEKIYNKVRGLLAWPGAFTYWRGKLLKIWRASVELGESEVEAGRIVGISKEKITVVCGSNLLGIRELQLESSKRLTTEKFIAGHKIMIGEKLG